MTRFSMVAERWLGLCPKSPGLHTKTAIMPGSGFSQPVQPDGGGRWIGNDPPGNRISPLWDEDPEPEPAAPLVCAPCRARAGRKHRQPGIALLHPLDLVRQNHTACPGLCNRVRNPVLPGAPSCGSCTEPREWKRMFCLFFQGDCRG